MARGRMIDQAFTTSSKLNRCRRDTRLAYASILGYLDREGRISAEPLVLKATVFLRSDFTIDEIAEAVLELAAIGLIHLYADTDHAAILQFVDFLEKNKPNANEAKSKLPGPDDDETTAPWDNALDMATGPHVVGAGRGDAHAMHVQRTEVVSAPAVQPPEDAPLERERRTSTKNVRTPPPSPDALDVGTPPQPAGGGVSGLAPPTSNPPPDLEASRTASALGRAEWQVKTDLTAGRIRAGFPLTKAQFDALQGTYRWKEGAQYQAVAKSILRLCEAHGDQPTAAALEAVLVSGERIKQPIPYVEAVLKRAAEAPGGAANYDYEADANRIFGEVN